MGSYRANTLKVGVGSFEQNSFRETEYAMAGGVNPLISGTGSPPGGTFRKNAQRGILMSTE